MAGGRPWALWARKARRFWPDFGNKAERSLARRDEAGRLPCRRVDGSATGGPARTPRRRFREGRELGGCSRNEKAGEARGGGPGGRGAGGPGGRGAGGPGAAPQPGRNIRRSKSPRPSFRETGQKQHGLRSQTAPRRPLVTPDLGKHAPRSAGDIQTCVNRTLFGQISETSPPARRPDTASRKPRPAWQRRHGRARPGACREARRLRAIGSARRHPPAAEPQERHRDGKPDAKKPRPLT